MVTGSGAQLTICTGISWFFPGVTTAAATNTEDCFGNGLPSKYNGTAWLALSYLAMTSSSLLPGIWIVLGSIAHV